MSDLRTAANQMLEALEGGADSWQLVGPAIDALKEALAEPDIDPVDEYRKGFIDGQIDMRDRPAEPVQEHNLSRCPKCNGPADNGHDREVPPNPYYCTKCMAEPVAWRWGYRSVTTGEMDWRGYVEIAAHPNLRSPEIIMEPLYTSPPQRPAEPVGVVTSMVKGGVTWHIWPDQMPDGTTLYAAAPIIKPEIKEDNSVPQAQQFLYNAWADEQIQKEKK